MYNVHNLHNEYKSNVSVVKIDMISAYVSSVQRKHIIAFSYIYINNYAFLSLNF